MANNNSNPLGQVMFTSILSLAERDYCERYKDKIDDLRKVKKQLISRRKRMSVKTFARKTKAVMDEFSKQEIIFKALLQSEREKLNYVIEILEEEQQATDRLQKCLLNTVKMKTQNDILEKMIQMKDTIDRQRNQLSIYKRLYPQTARDQLQSERYNNNFESTAGEE